jgi:transcriptional regulator with XRE-family HTH domain
VSRPGLLDDDPGRPRPVPILQTEQPMTTFASVLRDTIDARGMTPAAVHRATGVDQSTLSCWLAGTRLPTLQRADRLADVLEAPALSTAVASALRRRCVRCRRKFYAEARNRNHTRYCGKACRMAVHRARVNRTDVAASRLRTAKLERAIAAFCRGCEPDGICRTAACPLRDVSPFPLGRS